MSSSTSIKIGQHNLSKIEFKDIRPGDFICTYEALTTRSDLLAIEYLQKYASVKRRPELNKMFHAEIVVYKHPRTGMCRVAHANGSTRQVMLENDNFKEHHPGQALIVFRAVDQRVQREIVAIANKTAEAGNAHQCKVLKFDSLVKRIYYLFRVFFTENFGVIFLNKTLKNIAHMVVNFKEGGRFYYHDNTGPKAMRCVEYVANVVNVAVARIFSSNLQTGVSREEKIQSAFNQVKKLNQDYTFPFKLSNTDTTPASFVDFFLNNSQNFQTVGYLGEYVEPINGPALDVKGKIIQISPKILSELLPKNLFLETEIDYIYVARLMKALGILSSSWELYLKAAIDPIKIKALCACIYAKGHNQPLKINDSEELDRASNDLLLVIEKFVNKDSETAYFEDLPDIRTLGYKDVSKVLLIEKEYIKASSSLERTDKTLKISLNALASQTNKIAKKRSLAEKMDEYGKMTLKTIFLSPLYLGFSIAERILNENAKTEEKVCCKKTKDLLVLHEKVRKNGKITLTSDVTFEGHRPWIHYSIDNGITWYQDPFKDKGSYWDVNICVPKGKNITYMLFIGPEDIEDPDPIGNSKAWQKANSSKGTTVYNIGDDQENEGSSSVLKIADIFNPAWASELPLPIRSPFVENYWNECNTFAPLQDQPVSILEYEKNYAQLERDSIPLISHETSQEEEMANILKTFVEKEIGIKVGLDQIKFMKGGLGKGLSRDQIYKVYDDKNRPIFIIKIFMDSRGKFSREFFSLMNHKSLRLKSLNLPSVVGIGASQFQGKKILFLATNFIHGKSIHDLFKDLVTCEVGSYEREYLLQQLAKAYERFGEAIAEFHQAKTNDPMPLHPAFIHLLKGFRFNAFECFKNHFELSFLDRLQKYFDSRFATESGKLFPRGYFHGDINSGNIIYNSLTDDISLVDWPDGSLSVGHNGEPTGISFYDVIQIKNDILAKKAQGLTEQEATILYDSFIEKYNKIGLYVPSKETLDFFTSVDLLGSLKWFIDKNGVLEPKEFKTAERIQRAKLDQLRSLVES